MTDQTTLADYEREKVDLRDVPTEHLDVGKALATLEDAVGVADDVPIDAEGFDRLGPEHRVQAIALRLKLLSTTVQRTELETNPPDNRAFW